MNEIILDQRERVAAWMAEEGNSLISCINYYAMGLEKNGKLVAGILFEAYNKHNVNAHIVYKGFSKSFAELADHAFKYAFDFLKVKRITGYVEKDNEKALKLDKHFGFRIEGCMKKAGSNGQDMYILVLWPENYWRGIP